jgi:hypothetical protein
MRAALATLALALLAQGCDDDPAPVEPPCDITDKECQKAIFRQTAEVRGQDGAKMPPIYVITRAQYRDALERYLAEQPPDPTGGAIEAAYALLGVLPEDMGEADEAYIDDLAEGVAAFYSPGSGDVTIIDDSAENEVDGTYVLSHEFVHALQHQRGDLARPAGARDTDTLVSFDSLIEGEAVYLSNAFMAGLVDMKLDPVEMEKYFDNLTEVMLTTIAGTDAPLYLAAEILPYPLGGRGVLHAFEAEGLAGIEALHASEPRSLAFWLADAEPPATALRCDVPAAPPGFTQLERDRLGVAGLVAIEAGLGRMPSLDLGSVWRDDRVAIYANAEVDHVAIAYRVRFDATAAASELESAFAADPELELVRTEDELLVLAANGIEGFDTSACPALGDPFVEEAESRVLAALRRVPFMR